MTQKPKAKAPQPFRDEVKRADAARTPEENQAIIDDEYKAASEKTKRVDRLHSLAR
ncbi:hypothetical protein GCM10007874_40090 [Labrys miyagiensis]|uniref:YfhD family protein n=1 Tax=Labrys miyagiensis TaxID=346912 RepID=A0ABQ6CMX0_9HYPH|nr:hypothetical protein [Labrys miyagiensis]GLS20992.1 hypothetical protein GCM10007874_40090 [Labrys miyagiensis]